MQIVITGASGFVGTNLMTFFNSKGMKVVPISLRSDNFTTGLPDDADVIIHLAGKAHDTSNLSGAQDYYRINRDLTIRLFHFFLGSKVKDFFYFSSVKAVADTIEGILYENVQPSPVTPYGRSKMEAESYLLLSKIPQGKRVFIIRPCMIHGPGNKGNLNLLYEIVKMGFPWPLAYFKNQRSFLSVDNLNYLIGRIVQEPSVNSGTYNFADDYPLSTNEVIAIISASVGKKAKLWSIPPTIINSLARIGDLLNLPLNSERLKKLTESYVVSNQKIKTALSINELPVSAEQGLRKTIDSFKTK